MFTGSSCFSGRTGEADFLSSHCFCSQKIHQTDRSGSADENLTAKCDAGSLAGVYSDGKWFQQRSFFQRHVIRKPANVIS